MRVTERAPSNGASAPGYGLNEATRWAIGELVNRGWTVKPLGWWTHRPGAKPSHTPHFDVIAPDGRTVGCFPSDMLLTGEFDYVTEERDS
jgi:hypothetical protein